MMLYPEDFDPECCPQYGEHVWLFRDSYAGGYRSYLCDGCGCSGFMRSGQNCIELILDWDVRGRRVAHLYHHLRAADATTDDVYCWVCDRMLAGEEAAEAWPAGIENSTTRLSFFSAHWPIATAYGDWRRATS